MPAVRTGLDCLIANEFAPLRGLCVGLVTHPAAVDSRLRQIIDVLIEAQNVRVGTVFGPEHGLWGQAQDLVPISPEESLAVGDQLRDVSPVGQASSLSSRSHEVGDLSHVGSPVGQASSLSSKPHTGGASLRIVSLYGDSIESLRPTDEQLAGLDALVIDLQDVGSRYYTFQATMLYCLEAALPRKLGVFILDRPNPIGGVAVEGPPLREGFSSFVGCHDVPVRHGMTLGELARLYCAERGIDDAGLHVIACEGWRRDMFFDETGLPWVMPSPNMPTLGTAIVYPGQCLLEGTILSEGRGTTRPFEICGAPWIDAREFAARLDNESLPGVTFRPLGFRPTFQKHAGTDCGGIQIHVTDRREFQPVRTGLAVLAAMRELSRNRFRWRTETYEFVDHPIAIDLLFGGADERRALESGEPWRTIAHRWTANESAFLDRRRSALIY